MITISQLLSSSLPQFTIKKSIWARIVTTPLYKWLHLYIGTTCLCKGEITIQAYIAYYFINQMTNHIMMSHVIGKNITTMQAIIPLESKFVSWDQHLRRRTWYGGVFVQIHLGIPAVAKERFQICHIDQTINFFFKKGMFECDVWHGRNFKKGLCDYICLSKREFMNEWDFQLILKFWGRRQRN